MEYFNPGRALRARDDGIKSFVSSSAFAFFLLRFLGLELKPHA